MTTSVAPEVLENVLDAARECYGTKVEVSSIEEIPLDHPDRVIDKNWRDKVCPWKANDPYEEAVVTYTHTVTVRYYDTTYNCNYLATYGVTDQGKFHLWMD